MHRSCATCAACYTRSWLAASGSKLALPDVALCWPNKAIGK